MRESRPAKGRPFGFVFLHCRLTARSGTDRVYLGRPWRDHARVAFLYCEMGSHILPAGWDNWSMPNREKTSFFAEYSNTGPGAETRERVPWYHALTQMAAQEYTLSTIMRPGLPVEPSYTTWTKQPQ